jgi:two-component system sensor histidine kinase KdpD
LQICVKDLGPGIPAEERESIFEAYTHSRQHDQSSQRGAGLGLAVCRAIARAHGGDLVVKPRQTGGSNFVVSLPIADTEANYLISEISEETK